MFEEFVQLLQVFREAMCNEAGLRLVQKKLKLKK